MVEKQITIINKLGLHARAASKFASTAARFGCKIQTGLNGKHVDGKSIMSLMLLAASQGSDLYISCDGNDEDQAMAALCDLINDRFGEGE